jgi:hypothetical protein
VSGAFRIRGDQALRKKAPMVPHSMCGSGARWCARADAIFDGPDMHVVAVEIDDRQRLVLTIESCQVEAACPACGTTSSPAWAWPRQIAYQWAASIKAVLLDRAC